MDNGLFNLQADHARESSEELKKIQALLLQHEEQFRQYRAAQEDQRSKDKSEQAKTDKKIRRSAWRQTIFALVAAPLITLLIEHFDDIVGWLATVAARLK